MFKKIVQSSILIACLVGAQLLPGFFSGIEHKESSVPKAEAVGSYTPTGGASIVGSTGPNNSSIAAAITSTWKGTLSNDGVMWNTASNVSGLDSQLTFNNVALRNANKMIVTVNANAGSVTLQRFYQICDWVSSTGTDNPADTQCTGGGWRTLNKTNGTARAAIAETTERIYTWQIYDGYFASSMTSTTPVSTPLSNFVSGGNSILIRVYSPTSGSVNHFWDYAGIDLVIDSVYSPAGVTQVSGGSITTGYASMENPPALISGTGGTTGSDNVYFTVPGTAGSIAEFYTTYQDVRTYNGVNTILLSSEYSCTNTGPSFTPRLYNFTTSSWTSLTTAIPCSTSDATGRFALNNISVNDYISGGELRVGWVGSTNSTVGFRLDSEYVTLGSVNANSSLCEISFGTGTATDCTNTRDYDSRSGTPSVWTLTTELESTTMAHDYYPQDNDADATSGEAAASANVSFPVTMSPGMQLVGTGVAMNARSNASTLTQRISIRNFGTQNPATAWTESTLNITGTTYSYSDAITNSTLQFFSSGASDQIDTVNDRINLRFKTSTSTATTNQTPSIDFLMVSPRWVEDIVSPRTTLQDTFHATSGALITGTANAITSGATSGNTGSWKGTLAAGNFNWGVTSNAVSGLNQQLTFGGVELNGANKMVINIRASAGATTLQRRYQICDWVSTTAVDNAADAQCTGGGWRTLNKTNGTTRALITATAATTYGWHIYDGYWTTSLTGNTPVSTPLSNFVSSSGNILIRAHSTSAVAVVHSISYASVEVAVDPLYFASAFTQLAGGTVTTSYVNTANPPTIISGAAATGSDNVYLTVPGTAGAPGDFYLSYKNIKTYSDMNAILVRSEYSCSVATAGLNLIPQIYNFTSASWENLTSATIACSVTDATAQFVKGNISIGDYVSGGEIRVRWRTSANSTTAARLDFQYVLVGSVNANSSMCEISFGTGVDSDCANTRTYDSLGTPSVWTITSEPESATMSSDFYGFDNDTDATNAEHASAANLSFPVTLPDFSQLVGLGYVNAWQSGSTTMTTQWGIQDESGQVNTTGGWLAFGGTNALASYTYQDPVTVSFITTNHEDFWDSSANASNMRMRTTLSTLASSTNSLVDFAMVAPRWLEGPVVQSLAFSISDNTIAFGALSNGSARYATGNLLGSGSEVEAHTLSASTNAASGYTITVTGSTLNFGGNDIDAIGGTNTASAVGTEQFGLRATATGGSGAVSAPYAAAGFAFDTASMPDEFAALTSSDPTTTTYSTRYLANIATTTTGGTYGTVLTYTITANY